MQEKSINIRGKDSFFDKFVSRSEQFLTWSNPLPRAKQGLVSESWINLIWDILSPLIQRFAFQDLWFLDRWY